MIGLPTLADRDAADTADVAGAVHQMPTTRPLRPCTAPHCRTLTSAGRCPTHARHHDPHRATAALGYTARDWQPFRRYFLARLVAAGILPVCGAALEFGPRTTDSACRQEGLVNFTSHDGTSLHLDHEPPLRDDERGSVRAICDETRIQLLCTTCHQAKTMRERRQAAALEPTPEPATGPDPGGARKC